MNNLRKAMEMALDALDSCEFDYDNEERQVRTFDALLVNAAHRALHEALAQPDEIQSAVLAEREACAKLCEHLDQVECATAGRAATAIRSRGDKHD